MQNLLYSSFLLNNLLKQETISIILYYKQFFYMEYVAETIECNYSAFQLKPRVLHRLENSRVPMNNFFKFSISPIFLLFSVSTTFRILQYISLPSFFRIPFHFLPILYFPQIPFTYIVSYICAVYSCFLPCLLQSVPHIPSHILISFSLQGCKSSGFAFLSAFALSS